MDSEGLKKIEEFQKKMQEEENIIGEKDKAFYIFEIAKVYQEKKLYEDAIIKFQEVIEKTSSFNRKIDAIFEICFIGLKTKNLELISEHLKKCEEHLKSAGDWEKKNRYKVYSGLYHLLNKNFKECGKLFLEALMTFTSYELFDFKTFVFYTAITNIISVDRQALKNKVIDNSDVLSVIGEIPHLQNFLNTFYEGHYKEFFKYFYLICQRLKTDFYVSKHLNFFMNEMRCKVYTQFLTSYKSVTMENMASVFGVSVQFIDNELSNFISQGRISAKIDKVAGIIECNQGDQSVDLYQTTIRDSDILLNKIHKLSKLLEI